MNLNKILILFFISIISAGIIIFGCKKIELVRIAYVKTEDVTNIQSTTATANGIIVDLGEGGIKDHGFCWSVSNATPTKNDSYISIGPTSSKGNYSSPIFGLENTNFFIRAYVEDDNGIAYGEIKGGIWLKYDDGINFTGVGLNDGSNFDYSIRFPTSALTSYNGYRISKIRFFPTESALFHVEVFEGINPPTLVYYEEVNNVTLNTWNEYKPTNIYFIDSSVEVWVGIWVTDYYAGTFPAGCDNGPAVVGAGDMISFDDGLSWESLYTVDPSFNYNWNLEVYITNQMGDEVKLINNINHFNKKNSKSSNIVSKMVTEKVVK
jgi:hypothetical protein